IVTQTFADAGLRDRMVRSIALSAVLWFGVYWPAGWLPSWVANPYIPQGPMQTFNTGDVGLVNEVRQPRVGDVVLYQMSDYTIMLAPGFAHMREEIFTGRAIDRILAGPGDTVECRGGVLLVNGSPSRFFPLNTVHLKIAFKLKV